MSFPQHQKYKDSGVEWLGQVPEHWDIKPNKSFLTLRKSQVGDTWSKKTLLSLTLNGVIPRDMDGGGKFPAEFDAYQDVAANDLVLCLFDIDETPRSVGLAQEPGMITGAYEVFRCSGDASPKFVFYYYLHIDSFKGLRPFYTGLRKVVRPPTFLAIKVPFPPLSEQISIAEFLNRETAKIDALVAEQQRLMELLGEKRQAVISHAVTKGLNPKAPMKPSGVEWLGDVPAHWEVKPLRYLGRCQNGLNIDGGAFGSGFPFVSYGDVYRNRVLPPSPSGLVESSELDWERYSVERGDVFFTRTSETIDEIGIASTCFSTIPQATFAGFLIRFRPEPALDCSFSKHYFSNSRISSFFAREMNLVTRASLSQDLLKGLSVLLPPKSEQLEIGVFLDECIDTFEHLTIEAQRAIDLLQERRTALISAAVTGQIDVRASLKKEAA